jgi:hypothetical protein
MNSPTPADLLNQIAQIQHMERGKLSSYLADRDRSARADPYFKLQSWEHGKNVTRHVRSEQVPLVEEALAGYARFQQLVEQYAQIIIEQTRSQLASVGVKKKPGPRPGFSWRKNRKSRS